VDARCRPAGTPRLLPRHLRPLGRAVAGRARESPARPKRWLRP